MIRSRSLSNDGPAMLVLDAESVAAASTRGLEQEQEALDEEAQRLTLISQDKGSILPSEKLFSPGELKFIRLAYTHICFPILFYYFDDTQMTNVFVCLSFSDVSMHCAPRDIYSRPKAGYKGSYVCVYEIDVMPKISVTSNSHATILLLNFIPTNH